MAPEAVILFVLAGLALGYAAGRADRINLGPLDLGPLRRVGRKLSGADAPPPGVRRRPPGKAIRLRRRRPAPGPRSRVTPISAWTPGPRDGD